MDRPCAPLESRGHNSTAAIQWPVKSSFHHLVSLAEVRGTIRGKKRKKTAPLLAQPASPAVDLQFTPQGLALGPTTSKRSKVFHLNFSSILTSRLRQYQGQNCQEGPQNAWLNSVPPSTNDLLPHSRFQESRGVREQAKTTDKAT